MVRLEGTIKRYIGVSTDTKPRPGIQDGDGNLLTTVDVPAGSSFMESNTGRIYRWSGSEWTYSAGVDGQAMVLEAILVELTQIRQRLFLATT